MSQNESKTWPEEKLAVISDASLSALAGEKVFARGQELSRSGAMHVLRRETDPACPRIEAQVQGTSLYEVVLNVGQDGLAGRCSCPHAEDGWFCKHLVALALWWRAALTGAAIPEDADASKKQATLAKRARTVAANAAALEAFVKSQNAEDLAAKLLEWAGFVPELKRDLRAWMRLASVDDSPAGVKEAVIELLAHRDFIDYREASSYAAQAERILPLLDGLIGKDAGSALPVIEQAYRRLHRAIESADDSDGMVGDVAEAVGERWLAAVAASGPHPAAFAEHYLALRDGAVFDTISHAGAIAAMGKAAAARCGQLLSQRWEAALQAAVGSKPGPGRGRLPHHGRLKSDEDRALDSARYEYLAHLQATQNDDEVLRVLASDLSDPYKHLSYIGELERRQRQREALSAAQAAYANFPDDERIQDALLVCYERDGWDEEVLKLRQKRFEQYPTEERFSTVLAAAKTAKADVAALRERMWQWLIEREQRSLTEAVAKRWLPVSSGPDVSIRVTILEWEKRYDEALALAKSPNRVDMRLLERLALRLPQAKHAEAAGLLKRVFAQEMQSASSPYSKPLALVRNILERLPGVEGRQRLALLRAEFRAKRNFIKGLP